MGWCGVGLSGAGRGGVSAVRCGTVGRFGN